MATAIISDKFRIFNATQFLESLNEGTGAEPVADRTNMFFFVGRPWVWNATVEVFNVSGGSFTAGNQVYVGSNFGAATFTATIEEVTERSLILSTVGPNSLSTPLVNSGDGVLKEYNGADTGVSALAGEYNYGNESVPQQALDHQIYRYQIDDDMIAAKRITKTSGTPGFARNVVARYNWITGRTWDMYRPDYAATPNTGGNPDQGFTGRSPAVAGSTDLSDAEFYVMNSNYEVFKCVYNSEDTVTGVATSTAEPSQTAVDGNGIHDTGDGYLWKYMYTIGTTDVLRFLSTDFLPVNLPGEASRSSTEGLAVDGSIYVATSTTPGAAVTVPGVADGTYYAAVNGDGQINGTVAALELTVVSNAVTAYSMLNGAVGAGYTYGSISLTSGTGTGSTARGLFTDAALTVSASVTGAGLGGFEPVISPPGGHGSNMEYELNSKRVMTNIRLTYAEGDGDFPVDNDFRRIGLLQDPVDTATTQRAVLDTYSTLKAIKVNAATDNFQVDNDFEQITSSGDTAKGRVVSWVLDDGQTIAPYEGTLKYFQSPDLHTDNGVVYDFENATGLSQTVGGITTTASVNGAFTGTAQGSSFTAGLAEREIVENSGEVIYVENRRLITRAADQIEDIKLVIEF